MKKTFPALEEIFLLALGVKPAVLKTTTNTFKTKN